MDDHSPVHLLAYQERPQKNNSSYIHSWKNTSRLFRKVQILVRFQQYYVQQ